MNLNTGLREKGTARVLGDVANERTRQVVVEGFSPAADDRQDPGMLARAAACYARFAGLVLSRDDLRSGGGVEIPEVDRGVPREWPFSRAWWKPRVPRHDLIRAIALLVAEVERIDRQAQAETRAAILAKVDIDVGAPDQLRELERAAGLPEAKRTPPMPTGRRPFRDLAAERREAEEIASRSAAAAAISSNVTGAGVDTSRTHESDTGLVHGSAADSSPPACDAGSSDAGGACGGGE
jgi:hypothetical protein